jgi:rfaE bifunctional protein kinase chain/domain
VVANLEALGCRVRPYYPSIEEEPWTNKHRYLVGTHQLFRIDEDEHHDHRAHVDFEADRPDVLVISDYGRGVCSALNCNLAISQAMEYSVPVIVDPKGENWKKYRGAALIVPNQHELGDPSPLGGPYVPEVWPEYASEFRIAEKRGSEGIRMWEKGARFAGVYPPRARHVYDVTGAGDTVTAVLAATLGAQGELEHGVKLANMAAGLAVAEVGTVAVTAAQLIEEIYR